MRRVVTSDPHKDCSLCNKLRPPVNITFGDKESYQMTEGKRQKIELSNGEDLLLPEKKYPPECIPCYELYCGHRYHVQCLARLNPKKYTDITYRNGIRDTLELDEFHCLDCRGTQPINYMFNPSIEGGVNITDPATGTIYINVPDAFERAEADMNLFLERQFDLTDIELDLHYFIQDGTTRKEIEEQVLPDMKVAIAEYSSLQKPFNPIAVEYPLTREYALVNRDTGESINMTSVSLKDVIDGIDVHWTDSDIESFKTKKMNIKQLNFDYKKNDQHIERLNRIAAPIKRYLNGDKDARKLIHEDYIAFAMLYRDVSDSTERCVKNHAGTTKHLVTFDDFPIRETRSCSIMGGTRKRKLIRKRHKTVKNVFRRARTRL